MVNIKFSHNWGNKLDNPSFTTIRKQDPEKEAYYNSCIGKEFTVLLQGKEYGKAVLKGMEVLKFNEISEILVEEDTGTKEYAPIFEKFGIGPDTMVLLLYFQKRC